MKKTITFFAIFIAVCGINAQTVVADFENFTLTTNSYYKDTNSVSFQTSHASFEYEWTKGAFPYWSAGFSYTNSYDSTNGTFTNIYGVKPYKGYNNSNIYTVAKNKGKITLTVPQTTVEGFYYTNTTYAYESIKNGDSFSRKFGDTTGTGSGTIIAQGDYPDYFKVTVKGFKGGVEKTNTVEFFLADYRFANSAQDYVVKDWRFVNTSALGAVDSIEFEMFSTVSNEWGMLTPGFFGIDNFTTVTENAVGISINNSMSDIKTFPNPFTNQLFVQNVQAGTTLRIRDITGSLVYETLVDASQKGFNVENLKLGIYILEMVTPDTLVSKKIVKQ